MATNVPQKTILLVDDDKELLDSFKMIVETMTDHRALCFRTADEARARESETLACDAAVLDVNLGSGRPSGVELFHWLRSKGFSRPITFLTGHARSHPEVAEALKIENVRVHSKPIGMDLFVKIVQGEVT